MKRAMRYLQYRLRKVYRASSYQMVLSLAFTSVTVIGLVFFGLVLALRFTQTTRDVRTESAQRVVNQVNLNMDNYLRSMMRVSDTAYYRVIKDKDLTRQSLDDELSLLYAANKDELVSIAVFTEEGELISSAPLTELKSAAEPQTQDWFISAREKLEDLHFSVSHVQDLFSNPDYEYRWVISLSRQVELTYGGATRSGVLLVDMSSGGIERICKDAALDNDRSYLYLISGNGDIIYHPRQQLLHAGLQQENNLAAARYADGTHFETFRDRQRQVTVKTVGYTGWKLVSVTPVGSLWENYGSVMMYYVFILFAAIFLLVFANLRVSEIITAPLKKLDQAVKQLEAGAETVDLDVGGPHELEHLSRSISSMVSTMRHLMDDVLNQEQQKRRSELDVLQSQINPHFLYNTLDSVVWMTENGKTEDAVVMLTSLGRFFRISLSGGRAIIPISEELEHARHYLTIQKIRYKNKFTADIRVEEGMESLHTIKLIVQPILENAIYHGMAYADGDGEITVHAFREEGDVVIEVTDNGPGMPEELVAQLLDAAGPAVTPDAKGSGIGFRNVHRRLQLTFGSAYGLTILSEPDDGTTVRIRLPALDAQAAERFGKEEA